MHTFLGNFQKSGKYSAHISIHQAELRRKEYFVDQKSLSRSTLQIDYLNLKNSVRSTERDFFFKQGVFIVEYCNQLKNALINNERIRAIKNSVNPSIHTTIIIGVLNVIAEIQRHWSDVDQRITGSNIVQNRTLWKIRLTGTRKSNKCLCTDQ